MAVTMTTNVYFSPVGSKLSRSGELPNARFVAIATGTGDGSGGAVTATFYLNDSSASPSNYDTWYVISDVIYQVLNTGVAYKATLYIESANISITPEGVSSVNLILDSQTLHDSGTYNWAGVRTPMLIGHEVDNATDALLKAAIDTNTNTKAYYIVVRGFKYQGYPLVKRNSYWL